MKKIKTIKKRTIEYANKIGFYKLSLVKKRVKMYDKLFLMKEKAMICPECSHKSLEFEGGSYEEGYGDFIACNQCDFTSDVETKFEPLVYGNDFDVLMWFAMDIERNGIKEVEHEIGCSWSEFCTKTIIEEDMS